MKLTTLQYNPHQLGQAEQLTDIPYSTATGELLTATILRPWEKTGRYPAIVFVQGSGWTLPNPGYELPQLSEYARAGYVVMTIRHRNRKEGHPFPAFLQDTKCAIRFLRANAEKYQVDPDRIAIFGTSSGGNTALLTALTGDDPRYKTEEYAEFSDKVCCMVECFGPTWMERMGTEESAGDLVATLAGDRDHLEVMREMSPYCVAKKGESYPPMLLIHGDADTTVPYEQMLLMGEKLDEVGADGRMICVHGGPHEGTFWSRELHRQILAFLDAHML